MGRGMLCQIVDHDQRMLAAIAEILGHGEAGEGRDPLQSWRSGRRATTMMQRSGAPCCRIASMARRTLAL